MLVQIYACLRVWVCVLFERVDEGNSTNAFFVYVPWDWGISRAWCGLSENLVYKYMYVYKTSFFYGGFIFFPQPSLLGRKCLFYAVLLNRAVNFWNFRKQSISSVEFVSLYFCLSFLRVWRWWEIQFCQLGNIFSTRKFSREISIWEKCELFYFFGGF